MLSLLLSFSGVVYTSLYSGVVRRRTLAHRLRYTASPELPVMAPTRTPASSKYFTWSCTSEMSGDTTIDTPGIITAGSW